MVLAFLHPEVEYTPVAQALEGGTVHGQLGWLQFWDELLTASEDFRMTIDELADLGAGQVLAVGEFTVKWQGSLMELSDSASTWSPYEKD